MSNKVPIPPRKTVLKPSQADHPMDFTPANYRQKTAHAFERLSDALTKFQASKITRKELLKQLRASELIFKDAKMYLKQLTLEKKIQRAPERAAQTELEAKLKTKTTQ